MADLVAVMAAATFSYASYALLQLGGQLPYSSSTALLASLCFAALFLLMLDHEGAYKRANDLLRIREIEQILRVTVHAFGVGFLVSFFFCNFSRVGYWCWRSSSFRCLQSSRSNLRLY